MSDLITVPRADVDVLVAACTSYLPADVSPEVGEAFRRLLEAWDQAKPEPASPPPGNGQWMHIGFFGRIELQGYVTEITVGGQPVFRIDLPEKIWGGNPNAWEEYAASALHNRRPLTEESVRAAYEARLARQREAARQQAEWERQQRQYALEAGGQDGGSEDEYYEPEGLPNSDPGGLLALNRDPDGGSEPGDDEDDDSADEARDLEHEAWRDGEPS